MNDAVIYSMQDGNNPPDAPVVEHGDNEVLQQPASVQIQAGTCCSKCRSEFRLRKFNFCHPRRDFFYTSQWGWPPCVFIAYRLIIAGYILAWLIATSVRFPYTTAYPWPVWLTNWSYLLLTCHLVLAALIAVINIDSTSASQCCSQRDGDNPLRRSSAILDSTEAAATGSSSELAIDFDTLQDSLQWYLKLNWFLFAIVSNFSFIVTIVYFVALFPQLIAIDTAPPLLDDLHLHLVNSVVILLEIAISAIPIRLLHMLYPMLYGALYIIFSAIYWAVDHNHILYPDVLDWNKPKKTILILIVLAFVVIPILQLFIFGLYQMRMAIYKWLSYRR